MSSSVKAATILTSPADMHAWRREHRATLGFVPTMGYLHEGHLALVRRSTAENELTAASIFVNPTQFGPNEDFETYPRDEAADLAMLEAGGVDVVYMPAVEAMYPETSQTVVAVGELTMRLEGASRPGHFEGVTTVVSKLFNAVDPDRAYFGRKDAQQLRVIQRMVTDLDMSVQIVPCDTIREPDGLALSSRNAYLTEADRAAAPVVHRALTAASDRFVAGMPDAPALRDLIRTTIEGESLADIEYVSIAHSDTLHEIEGSIEVPALISLAVCFGATRLIDNVELEFAG